MTSASPITSAAVGGVISPGKRYTSLDEAYGDNVNDLARGGFHLSIWQHRPASVPTADPDNPGFSI